MSAALVLGASFAYLLLLFAVAHWADRRARQGRSVIANAWVYTLSMGVYCTAWTYFGSVGRAAANVVVIMRNMMTLVTMSRNGTRLSSPFSISSSSCSSRILRIFNILCTRSTQVT